MKKNTLKRTFAALAVSAVAASMASMTAAAAFDNGCDKQDNKEVVYGSSSMKWEQPAKWKVPTIDPSNYTGTAKVSFDKVKIPYEKAVQMAKDGTVQTISLNVSGAAGTVNAVGFHTFYDTRLTLVPNKRGKAFTNGDAIADFMGDAVKIADGQYNFVASAGGNYLEDGKIFSIDFKLPADVKAGDLYPIGLQFWSDGTTTDLFYNQEQNDAGRLQMAYIFTQGIENGYIAIENTTTTTSTTTTTTTSTSTTTTTSTSTSSTSTSSTTSDTDTDTDTTSTTSGKGTVTGSSAGTGVVTKGSTTTKSSKTTKSKTTTKGKAQDSPVTGVAGVGVAAAGLAIAVGTAFALRKKED